MTTKKAANGSGTIRPRKDGRWEGIYTIGRDPGTGKQIRKSVYAKTKEACAKALRAATAAVDTGTYMQPSKITVQDWMRVWLDEYCSNLKERTKNTYRSAIETRILPGLGATKLSALSPVMVQKFINNQQDLSPKTVKNVFGILHKALEKAVSLGYLAKNPSADVTLPRVEHKEVSFLAGDDLRRFLEAIQGNPYERVFLLAIFTGMREGELLALSWGEINFTQHTITVQQQLQLIKGEYKLVTTKNSKARRLSPAPYVFEILKEQFQAQQEQIRLAGELWSNPNNFVFTKPSGENIARNTLYMNFKRAIKAAGLPDSVRFHDLRHSYAVLALEAGDNLKEIQAALGHYSSTFTMNTYAHVSEAARSESALRQENAIQNLLSPASSQ